MAMTGAIAVSLLLGLIVALLASETEAWTRWLTERIIAVAVKRAPLRYRDRLWEEWRGHVNDTPGTLVKLFVALGMLRAAFVVSRESPDAKAEEAIGLTERKSVASPDVSLDEIMAAVHRIIAEEEPRQQPREEIAWDTNWPPICEGSSDRRHRVSAAALYPSIVYGGRTFQGPCERCHKWIDTGECCD
jgi:hypothetical protein